MLIRNVRLSDPLLKKVAEPFNGSIYINPEGQIQFPPFGNLATHTKNFDAQGALLLPGLMDTHIHGCDGADFADGKMSSLEKITTHLGKAGVAYCYATFVSLPLSELKYALSVLDSYILRQQSELPGRAQIVGVHLEGPYISAACCGAHSKKALLDKIDMQEFAEIIAVAPHITEWKMTLAPDVQGAVEFIRQMSKGILVAGRHIRVSIYLGHSNASPELIEAALAAGAVGFTHLGNANNETMHRSQTAINLDQLTSQWVKTALEHGDKNAEIIADGNHVSVEFIKLVYRHFKENVLLISDALRPAGKPDGDYTLGALAVVKQDNRIVLKQDETKLAGSAMLLPQMLPFYCRVLKGLSLSALEMEKALVNTLYHAPRKHYFGPSLPDLNQFILVDVNSGDVVLHMTNKEIFTAQKKSLMQPVKLFEAAKLTSPRDMRDSPRVK